MPELSKFKVIPSVIPEVIIQVIRKIITSGDNLDMKRFFFEVLFADQVFTGYFIEKKNGLRLKFHKFIFIILKFIN
jgi:hypothetical protein